MIEKELMRLAVEEARKSEEPVACGVVIAKAGEVVAMAHNTQRKDKNATAHAEINAIAAAGKALGSKNLEECVAYCSCEPCTMCLSAFVFAKIDTIYYSAPLAEVAPLRIQISSEELFARMEHKPRLIRMNI